MDNLSVEILDIPPASEREVEIVERKGLGHPDSICDNAVEAVSVALSKAYIDRFGSVCHHNIDKGLLAAGQVEKDFGGGRVVKPMEFFVGDRATFSMGTEEIDVVGIATESVRSWFKDNLKHVDIDRDLDVRVVLKPGSAELTDIFSRDGRVRVANDTSAAVGYAPLTATEEAVLGIERFLNSSQFKENFPDTGEDVKVMGLRRGSELDITFAMPLMANLIGSEGDYFRRKEEILAVISDFTASFPFKMVNLGFNTLDKPGQGLGGVYISLLGTSAEDADSGQVGRGNRVNGLISLNRPMGTEAAAGKNPVSHVGKIYNILANKAAEEIYTTVAGIKEVSLWFLSKIGESVDSPWQVSIEIVPEAGADKTTLRRESAMVVARELARIEDFTLELSRGEYPVC